MFIIPLLDTRAIPLHIRVNTKTGSSDTCWETINRKHGVIKSLFVFVPSGLRVMWKFINMYFKAGFVVSFY